MMGPRLTFVAFLSIILAICPAATATQDSDGDNRIELADLAAYRAALSGRATADDARPSVPPTRVGFRDLWGHPESHRGRRVTVSGRLERSFRQGAVGSFPPLTESWIFTASGDPMCIVYPRPEEPRHGGEGGSLPVTTADPPRRPNAPAGTPGPGRMVRFTGTFLKIVRYTAGDGERLAPLIVGEKLPEPEKPGDVDNELAGKATPAGKILRAVGGGGRPAGKDHRSWTAGSPALGLGLAGLAAVVIAIQHVRGALLRQRGSRRRRIREGDLPDPPLEFLDNRKST